MKRIFAIALAFAALLALVPQADAGVRGIGRIGGVRGIGLRGGFFGLGIGYGGLGYGGLALGIGGYGGPAFFTPPVILPPSVQQFESFRSYSGSAPLPPLWTIDEFGRMVRIQ